MIGFPRRVPVGLLLTILVCGISPARADIYRYRDAEGVLHFTNVPTESHWSFYRKESPGQVAPAGSYQELIRHYADQYHLDEALVKAVIKVESDYQPHVVSRKGAQGLMQLIPATARDLNVMDPFDPSENIRGGSLYLRRMLDQFNGDLELALAAYNAGPTTVRRYGGIPPYQETINYVKRVKHYLNHYRAAGDTLL